MDMLMLVGLVLHGSTTFSEVDSFKTAVDEKYPCVAATEDFKIMLRKRTQKQREAYFVHMRYFSYWSCWDKAMTKEFHLLGEETGFFKARRR